MPLDAAGVPQRVDADAVLAYLQREYFGMQSHGSKMQEYTALVGTLAADTYAPAPYIQAHLAPLMRKSLARLRTGSHMLGLETGRWRNLPRDQRTCMRCGSGAIDDVQHMVFDCEALVEQRIQHASIFAAAPAGLEEFFGQEQQRGLGAFARACAEVVEQEHVVDGEAAAGEEFDI